jgi:RNA polymerase sigma-70 factor (ECF subfamily)
MEETDNGLIRATAKGDHLAFEQLVRRYQGPVLNFIYRQIGERHAAEDLTQDVFMRVYRAAPNFEPRGKVSSWIFKIAFNLSLNEKKRMRRSRRFFDALREQKSVGGGDATPDVLEMREREVSIMVALGKLPENQRAAIHLRTVEGLSYLEVSEALSVSVPAVESLLHRARKRLRELLLGNEKEE